MPAHLSLVPRPLPRNPLGKVHVTPGVLEHLTADPRFVRDLSAAFVDFQAGRWGLCDPDDCAANEKSLVDGSRVFAAYLLNGTKVWIITDAVDDDGKRTRTTVLLPEEY